jgi:hypothetical protein
MSAIFDMCAMRDPAGHIRVVSAHRAFTLPAGELEDAFAILSRIPLFSLAFAPTFVVDRDGALLRIEDAEDFRSTLTMLVEDRFKDMSFAPGHEIVASQVKQDASDAVLEREVMDWWASSIGLWNGRALARGQPVQWTTTQSVPAPGGTAIEVARRFQFEFVRRTPCLEGEAGERCVELTMASDVPEEDRKRAAERLRELVGGGDTQYEYPENGIEARVVTDPDTLLPYRVHRSRRSSMIMKEGEQQVAGGWQQDEMDAIYTYPAAPSGACDARQ